MTRLIGILVLLTIALTCAMDMDNLSEDDIDVRKKYELFKKKYKKSNVRRLQGSKGMIIFKKNLKEIEKMQASDKGTATFGVTKFSDMSQKEFLRKYTGPKLNIEPSNYMRAAPRNLTSVPDCFDWQDQGAVGPVENQGMCGSCWAFSVVGNIEGVWKVKKGQLLRLSKQQLLDCCTEQAGCNGGWPHASINELARQGGINRETDYPYKETAGRCSSVPSRYAARVSSALLIENDENAQLSYMMENGPLSVALNANGLQFYKGGVLDLSASQCIPEQLNHAVLTTGFGVERGVPYWKIKNSWGEDFGNKGYFKMRRGSNTCGIGIYATSAVLD